MKIPEWVKVTGSAIHNLLTGWADAHPRRAANLVLALGLVVAVLLALRSCGEAKAADLSPLEQQRINQLMFAPPPTPGYIPPPTAAPITAPKGAIMVHIRPRPSAFIGGTMIQTCCDASGKPTTVLPKP